jgi:hypothetical protein
MVKNTRPEQLIYSTTVFIHLDELLDILKIPMEEIVKSPPIQKSDTQKSDTQKSDTQKSG